MVKTDEDDDPIAVLAALNTQEHKDTAFLKQIRAFLLAKCPAAHKAALNKVGPLARIDRTSNMAMHPHRTAPHDEERRSR